MGKNVLRTWVAGFAIAVVAVVAAPDPAAAQPSPAVSAASVSTAANVSTAVTTGLLEDDGLAEAFGDSPTSLLQAILCPVITGLTELTTDIPGVGPLLDALPALVCSINVLGYVFKTTYLPPSGPPVIRYTKALAGVPTPLNVDGAGLPDFQGTLGLNLTLNGITLAVQRSLFFPSAGKVAIEAIAINPVAEDTYIGFGLDGTAAGTPSSWQAKVSVLGISASTVDLGLDIKANNPQTSLAAIGEMFSGPDADNPEKIYRGKADFSPVPATFKTELRLSDGRQQVIVKTTPTKLTADLDVITPGREQNIDATVDQLPSTVDIVHTTTGSTENVTYDASAPIAKVTGAYRDKVNGNIQTAAALDAWGIPTHIEFEQTAEKTNVNTGTGKIDRIQARFAQGSDVEALDPSTSPFARFHRTTPTKFTAALQLSDLQSVEFNQSAPYGGRLIFATAPGLFPFTADDDVTSTHLEGHLSNLPADTSVEVDLANGKVTFDGHGTGIDQIFVKATRPQSSPFFAQVSRLEATLDGLPALEVIDIKQENDGVTASASNPLGTITLLASDGSNAPNISGSVASFVDNGTIWRAFLRMSGLKSVGFQPNPLTADLQTSAPQVFKVNGDVGGVTFDGTINQLPSHLTFSMANSGSGQAIDFNTHGQTIGSIDVQGTGLPVPAGMPNFEALIKDLPSHITLTLPANSSTSPVKLDLHGAHITRVYAQAYANGQHLNLPNPDTRHRLEFIENSRVVANLLGVGSAEFGAAPIHIKYDIGSQPLDYEVVMADAKFLRGVVSNPTPATIDVLTSNKMDVHYRATTNTQIDSITLKTDLAGGYIDVNLQNLAPDVKVCFSSTNKACKPSFVPTSVLTTTDGDTFNMPPALFDFSLIPTNLSGGLWPNRFELDGTYCFDESNPATCLDSSAKKKRITIDDLKFGKVAVGAGFKEDGCDLCTAGRVYGYFDTDNTLISGDVRYFDNGDDGPFVHYNTNNSDSSGIQAQNKLLFVQYCIVCLNETNLQTVSGGSFSCVAEPHLLIDIPVFDDLDVLSGSFINFC